MRVDTNSGGKLGVSTGSSLSPFLSIAGFTDKAKEMTGEFCHLRPVTCMKGSRLGKNLLVFEENKSEVDVLGGEVPTCINSESDNGPQIRMRL